jgi:hypothetical protein
MGRNFYRIRVQFSHKLLHFQFFDSNFCFYIPSIEIIETKFDFQKKEVEFIILKHLPITTLLVPFMHGIEMKIVLIYFLIKVEGS